MFGKTKNQLNARAALVLAVAAFAGAATVCVQAGTPDAPASVHVKYSDLNLNTPEGARRLYSRIEKAAYAACGTSREFTESKMMAPGFCVPDTIARAVRGARIHGLARAFIETNGPDAAQRFGITPDLQLAGVFAAH